MATTMKRSDFEQTELTHIMKCAYQVYINRTGMSNDWFKWRGVREDFQGAKFVQAHYMTYSGRMWDEMIKIVD